jgi:phosphoglycerate dehydrogenase-like enzyme
MTTFGRILITYGGYVLDHPECGGALREAGLELAVHPREGNRTSDELVELCRGAVAVIADADPFDAAALAQLPELRIIARTGVGLDSIDLPAASAAGIPVTVTPGTNDETVADHALALMLAALRRLSDQDAQVRGGGWRDFSLLGPQLHGATVGIIGYGAIGRAVGRRLRGFGAELLIHDPPLADADAPLVELDELLRRSDVVTVHAPNTPATNGLIDARALALMKPGAVLVNTARGPLVDEDAVAAALHSGALGFAALDVFEIEPPIGRPILSAPRTLFSPHIAGSSDASHLGMSRMATESVLARLQGRRPEHVVNPESLDRSPQSSFEGELNGRRLRGRSGPCRPRRSQPRRAPRGSA